MSNESLSKKKLAEASFLIRNGRPVEAIPILDVIVDADPTCSWAVEERGRAKQFSGDLEGSIADFTRMIAQWPTNPKGLTCRADVRGQAGDLRGAIDDYSSAIELNPKHPFAFLQRGRLRAELGEHIAAISDFTADMDVSPNGRLSGLLNRGRTKYVAGDLSGAITDLTEAIALEGDRPIFSALFRGRAKFAAKEFNGAIADFSAVIEAFPQLTNAYRHRAEARALSGDKQGAADDQSRYEQLGGRDLPAYL
ncbi:MAG TPA: tetratricopeptide repeat protein [Phycisphaerae bacterium]|jgi:tetratricopeptide (TPR) repeat protein